MHRVGSAQIESAYEFDSALGDFGKQVDLFKALKHLPDLNDVEMTLLTLHFRPAQKCACRLRPQQC